MIQQTTHYSYHQVAIYPQRSINNTLITINLIDDTANNGVENNKYFQ